MFPKFAESGTGGIPRRAFNDPRALESLGSSNLSTQFTGGRASIGVSINGRVLPDPDDKALVRGVADAKAVQRAINKDIRALDKAQRGLPNGEEKDRLVARWLDLRTAARAIDDRIQSWQFKEYNPLGREAQYVPAEYARLAGVKTIE